jgi:pSer/pThr/pTyr-binding forkhead associated (FHA) protein
MARLVVLSEGMTGRTCELKAEKTTVGRLEDNAFQITEPSVSSHHCEIVVRGKEVVVKDLNSTNGTFIDGDPVTESALKPGQILRLGQVEIRLDDGTPPAPGAPGGAAAPVKKPLEPKSVVQQGVKLNDLEPKSHTVSRAADALFKKKSNKINQVFVAIAVVLLVVVIVLLVKAVLTSGGP